MNDTASKTIVRDPARFDTARAMWDLMLTGLYTPNAIRQKATTEWGFRQRPTHSSKGGPVSAATVYMMFTNQFYYGVFDFGNERFQGAHEPMVTKEEFDRVQMLLRSRSRQRPKRLSFTYSGLMTCGECGAAITAEHKFKLLRNTGIRKKYVYYHCTKHKVGTTCTQRVIEEQALENQIRHFLASLTISQPFLSWTRKVLGTFENEELQQTRKIVASLEQRESGCGRELSELLNVKLKGLIEDDEYLRKKNELQSESVGLKQQLNRLRTSGGSGLSKCLRVFNLAESALRSFDAATSESKRALLTDLCSNLVLKDKILLITAQKPFRVIRDFLETPAGKEAMFEPGDLSLTQRKTAPQGMRSFTKLRILNDVRTAVKKYRERFTPGLYCVIGMQKNIPHVANLVKG